MPSTLPSFQHDYTLVGARQDTSVSRCHGGFIRAILLLITLLCAVAWTGILVGRHSTSERADSIPQLSTISKVFRYNSTYGQSSSDRSDQAWEALFPRHGGFFVHPNLAPRRSAFSAFHQLHCLNSLRTEFYALYEVVHGCAGLQHAIRGDGASSLPHVRHCIDLLRQSIMCRPDLTVEAKDEALGGVTGFGTKHQCKDWDELLVWTAEWENIGAPVNGNIHDHHHGQSSCHSDEHLSTMLRAITGH